MSKRGNNEGTIAQRKDGAWCSAISLDGKGRKFFYGKTRKEVAQKLAKALRDQHQGLPILTDERETVAQFLDRWLEDSVKPTVRPRTHESYRQLVRLHISPGLGKRQLVKLGPQDVQAFLNGKLASGLSPRTVQYLRAVLRRALVQALKWGLVARNVATLVDPPKVKRATVKPLNPDQAKALLEACKGHRLEALYTVALALGLRQGEALGLRWEDLDLESGVLRVQMQLQRIGGKAVLTEPKTDRSRRTIALPTFAVKALREHRIRQLEERLLAGSRWQEWGLVFPSTIGTPMDARNLVTQYHKLLDEAGLPRRRFHDLRHTCATLLLVQGVDLRVVMETLGHSQISLTANTYQHVLPALLKDAAGRMDALFGTGS